MNKVIIGFLVGVILGAFLWIPATRFFMDKPARAEDLQTQIYPRGSFTLTFYVNEDVIDLPAKEILTISIEEFVKGLSEVITEYRLDGDIEHIKNFFSWINVSVPE